MANPARTVQSAFTLIELLIVIAIIGILAAASIPVFSSFTTSQRLSQAAKQVKQDLRSAQNRAINNVNGKAWQVRFDVAPLPPVYTVYECDLAIDGGTSTCTFTNCSLVVSKSFSDNFSFTAAESVGFEQITGRVCAGTSLLTALSTTITLELDASPRTITVSAGGQIAEQ